MKRILLLLFISGMSALSFAQSTQKGVVKEYNDAKKKTPLAGVELVVNNAGSNVSGKDGRFTLSFRTLKPGDKVDVRKIMKAGYEIFNKEALDAWRIANDGSTFTIVLCKSSKFKALKDQYNAVASKSYAQQQKKDEDHLANLLREGKLQQAEYEKKLKELRWKRNQYVHEGSAEFNGEDTEWLAEFYKKIISCEDPLSIKRTLEIEAARSRKFSMGHVMNNNLPETVQENPTHFTMGWIVVAAISIVMICILMIGLALGTRV